MAQTLQKGTQIGLNVDDTDGARFLVLKQKAKSYGLQESEKEELKALLQKGARGI